MTGKEIRDIVLFGTGNVSYHLTRAFIRNGLNVAQVVARTGTSAEQFAFDLGVPAIASADGLAMEADLYILAVSDDSVLKVAESLDLGHRLLVHTSGSVPMEALKHASDEIGVLYPLQTLTYGKETDFDQVPVCIEASSREGARLLTGLAGRISNRVLEIDSDRRKALHLSAVFASNFSYHMYTVASEILRQNQMDPTLLLPLIRETAVKALRTPPGSSQTGPAARGDMKIIEQHLEQLEGDPEYREIYRVLTESILSHKQRKKK